MFQMAQLRALLSAQRSKIRQRIVLAACTALVLTMALPTFAQETAPTIDFDLAPFFTSLNQYLPIFIGLFAVIGGIAGAMALASFVIGKVVDAFSGKSI